MNKRIKGLVIAATAVLTGCCSCDCGCHTEKASNISVFASFIRKTAKERNISIAEAADMLYDLGVRGFDIGPEDKDLPELAATKLRPINFYFFPRMFNEADCATDCKRCLDQAERYGVPRCMVVPPNFTNADDQDVEFAKILRNMKMIVAEAKKRGIAISVEDFGGTSNPCSYAKYLRRLLDEIPDLRLALDSGNLYYAGRGEDILGMMEYAKGRIGHLHLKDQKFDNNRVYETLGLGAVPNERIVKTVNAQGYDGWYTLENAVGGDTYADAARQVAVLKTWFRKMNKMKKDKKHE